MKAISTSIEGCCLFELENLEDDRGHFTRVMELEPVRAMDPGFTVKRVNRSLTRSRGVIRGLHYQREPMAEAKLVQCLSGSVFDVCVDIRPSSPTYLQWTGAELSPENQRLMLVPMGCAHGFQSLVENSVVEYFVDGLYSPAHEGGIRWNDPAIGIAWPVPCSMTSPRDAGWPFLDPGTKTPER